MEKNVPCLSLKHSLMSSVLYFIDCGAVCYTQYQTHRQINEIQLTPQGPLKRKAWEVLTVCLSH